MVDAGDSKSPVARRGGSSPPLGTTGHFALQSVTNIKHIENISHGARRLRWGGLAARRTVVRLGAGFEVGFGGVALRESGFPNRFWRWVAAVVLYGREHEKIEHMVSLAKHGVTGLTQIEQSTRLRRERNDIAAVFSWALSELDGTGETNPFRGMKLKGAAESRQNQRLPLEQVVIDGVYKDLEAHKALLHNQNLREDARRRVAAAVLPFWIWAWQTLILRSSFCFA